MSRPCSALFLLLGLAGPGAAQAPSPVAWTLAIGDYTIYGRTTYIPTVTLRPRIVYDTAHGVDSARVVDSVRTAAADHAGFAAGLSTWPTDAYCGGMMSAAMQQVDPRALLGRLQLAARCKVRLVLVPPRRLLTANGQPEGEFSVDSARRFTDLYAAVLPADTIRKYRGTILGLNLADDYGCLRCWGGRAITQAEIAEWAAYTRARLPGIPLGVRVTPDWVAAHPPLAPQLDYAWAQYATRKGDAQAYFDRAATIGQRLGLRVVMGVNTENCYGAGTSTPCTAADLVRFGGMAVRHPGSCAFISWRYREGTWARAEVREAWEGLAAVARGRKGEECRRVGSGG
ncbi:MAG: hypothetical protein ACREM9_10960 [Gemmatimonadales bacterium]